MITSEPTDWKDLQDKVNYILTGVGLISEKETLLKTPRGSVEIDVYAFDPNSVDKVKYIIECKNWNKLIPQTVVHSFCTIMNETGGNIGYIISKKGFQKGAIEYSQSSNIKLFSYFEFQAHYFDLWYCRCFSKEIFKFGCNFFLYLEPSNFYRERYTYQFEAMEENPYSKLVDKYFFLYYVLTRSLSKEYLKGSKERIYSNHLEPYKKNLNLEEIKNIINYNLGITIEPNNYLELLLDLKKIIKNGTDEFVKLFGEDIFLKY